MFGMRIGMMVMIAPSPVLMRGGIRMHVKVRSRLAIDQSMIFRVRMTMRMTVMSVMSVVVTVQRRERQAMRFAKGFVAAGGIAVAAAGAVLQPTADALDMVMMTLLRHADLGFEAQHLLTIFTHRAVH